MRTFLVLAMMIAATSCVKRAVGDDGRTLVARDYYPLKVGNAWSYDVNMLGERRQLEIRIEKEADAAFVDSQGQKLFYDGLGIRDDRRYLLKNPLELGTKWTNVVSVSSVEKYEIVRVDYRCNAPSGTYEHCVLVESQNPAPKGLTLINEMTFAPGVGLVSIQTAIVDSTGLRRPQSSLSLTRFTRAP